MNQFQREAVFELQALAKSMHSSLEIDSTIDASRYVRCKIFDLDVWIYPTGDADFSSSYIDRRFEKFDYKSTDALIQSLVQSIQEVMRNRDRYIKHPEKDPKPLLNRLFNLLQKSLVQFTNKIVKRR